VNTDSGKMNTYTGNMNTDSGNDGQSVQIEISMGVHVQSVEVFTFRQNECS